MVAAACTATTVDGFVNVEVSVADQSLTVAEAVTSEQRSLGLQGLDGLPRGVDGMLFEFPEPRETSFHMRTVGFDLDIWWFDGDGVLIGTTLMEECLDGGCVSYPSPGPITWALETEAGAFDFQEGSTLTLP